MTAMTTTTTGAEEALRPRMSRRQAWEMARSTGTSLIASGRDGSECRPAVADAAG